MLDLSPYLGIRNFGIHCPKKSDAIALIEHVYEHYPEKRNTHRDMLRVWEESKEDTIYYLHFRDNGVINNGRVGGPAAAFSQIIEFSELVMVQELPIERSDVPTDFLFGL